MQVRYTHILWAVTLAFRQAKITLRGSAAVAANAGGAARTARAALFLARACWSTVNLIASAAALVLK